MRSDHEPWHSRNHSRRTLPAGARHARDIAVMGRSCTGQGYRDFS